MKAANLLLDLQDALKDTKDRRTGPSYGLVSQDVLSLPVKGPHVEETVQDPVVHTGLLLFHSTSDPNVVPPKGIVIVTVSQGVPMPMTSGLVVVSHLHTAQDRVINNIVGISISW